VLVALLSSVVVSLGVVPAAQAAPRRDVVANLWEWNWSSVANECTTVLGPQGYGAVQVAPPQDSLSRSGPEPVHPWWEVYQPVDYNLTSRMGDESQFRSMVNACRRAGVRVIVDAVINHMTGQGDVSYVASTTPSTSTTGCTPATISTTRPPTARRRATSSTSTTTCR